MHFAPRRIAAAAVVAAGLALLAAPAAQAVVDPFGVTTCLAGAPSDLTALADPAAATELANPAALAEPAAAVPGTHCLAP